MTTDNSDTDDESTIESLREKKEQLESRGWPTDSVDEELEAKERRQALAEERIEIEEKLAEADRLGFSGAAVEVLQNRRAEIDEELTEADRERAAELREEADKIDPEVDTGRESATSSGSFSTASLSSSPVPKPSETKRVVDVDEALEKWGIDRANLDEALEAHEQRAETFEESDWTAMAEQTRTQIEVLEAAKEGRETVEPSSSIPGVHRLVRADSE